MNMTRCARALALGLQILVAGTVAVTLPGCGEPPEQAVTSPGNVLLIVHDPADPACTTDAGVAWALYWPHQDDFSEPKWLAAIPDTQQPHPGGPNVPVCVYTAAVTAPGDSLSLDWRVRALDESSWVASCDVEFVPTPSGQHNVVQFTRGASGCVLNP